MNNTGGFTWQSDRQAVITDAIAPAVTLSFFSMGRPIDFANYTLAHYNSSSPAAALQDNYSLVISKQIRYYWAKNQSAVEVRCRVTEFVLKRDLPYAATPSHPDSFSSIQDFLAYCIGVQGVGVTSPVVAVALGDYGFDILRLPILLHYARPVKEKRYNCAAGGTFTFTMGPVKARRWTNREYQTTVLGYAHVTRFLVVTVQGSPGHDTVDQLTSLTPGKFDMIYKQHVRTLGLLPMNDQYGAFQYVPSGGSDNIQTMPYQNAVAGGIASSFA